MAIFGDKIKNKKEKTVVVRHSHAVNSRDGSAHDIIRAPWFSEKALLSTDKGIYAFAVSRDATKAQIAGAIREIYKVTPKSVKIVNLPAKKKALRTRRGVGSRSARNKAYIYLNAGDTIKFA